MNIVGLLGKVSSEPKSKTVGNYKVTSFYLSVQGAGNWNKDGSTSNYGYGSFLVEAWGKLADTIEQHCPKGTFISISGSLRADSWISREGESRTTTKIRLNSFSFVSAGCTEEVESEESEEYDPFAVS
jgi:single-strand DNA-binding protein